MMRIASVETRPYELTFKEPYITSRGRLERRSLLLVRVIADGGLTGLGEAAPLMLRGGPGASEITSEIEAHGRAALEGAEVPADLAGVVRLVERCQGNGCGRQALAGIDIALHDLAAKRAEVPLWRFLGASEASPVPVNATLPGGAPAHVAELAARHAAAGFRTFKLKLGLVDDVAQLAAVRAAVGPEARIRIDANEAWSVEEAIAILAELAEHGVELAEQPVAGLDGLAEVRRRSAVPIAADESVVDAEDARSADALGACDLATIKLAKAGGLAAAREVAAVLPVYLSSALDGPVGIAAALHLAQVVPPAPGFAEIAHGLATLGMFTRSVEHGASALAPADGMIAPPPGPGLGVDLDLDALEDVSAR